ncbi:hypothetical protein [Dialister sp.]|uniref:hypothetical protein n=1 Tax=Dialister sp. TaxID=1955814 RepID=UPI00257FF4AC|nr:hypothetical protein [Dialister sp.]
MYGYSSGLDFGDVIGWIIGAIVVVAIINVFIAQMMSFAASEKGYDSSESHAFLMCFFFGIFGCIYVAALPDKVSHEQNGKIVKNIQDVQRKLDELKSDKE